LAAGCNGRRRSVRAALRRQAELHGRRLERRRGAWLRRRQCRGLEGRHRYRSGSARGAVDTSRRWRDLRGRSRGCSVEGSRFRPAEERSPRQARHQDGDRNSGHCTDEHGRRQVPGGHPQAEAEVMATSSLSR
jgi:hypothetical protein